MTDPIADLLIRIKNGYQARKKIVLVPYSKIKENICLLLVKEGFLEKLKIQKARLPAGQAKFKTLELTLKYKHKQPVINEIRIISKQSLRIYKKATEIPKVKMGYGITIVSTPAGLMTDFEARKKNLGGEIICQVW